MNVLILQAKYDQNKAENRQAVLPYIQSDSDLQSLEHKHSFSHSKSVTNLNDVKLNKNGFNQNHILFQNPERFEHVALIPVSHNTAYEGSEDSTEQQVHSRGHNVYDI